MNPRVSRTRTPRALLNRRVLRDLSRGGLGADGANLLEAILDEWGGMGRFAHDMVLEFHSSRPGSITRQRILECVCRLINTYSNEDDAEPVEDMTEEELVASILANLPLLDPGEVAQ
jgi:hypothetical protein